MLPSTHSLLHRIVDYAGTFPPSTLTLADAAAEYARARASTDGWMLDRLVISTEQLPAVEELLEHCVQEAGDPWPLTVVVRGESEPVGQLTAFNERWQRKARVMSVEFGPAAVSRIAAAMALVPSDVDAFFEIPIGPGFESHLEAVKTAGAAAKIRTGGVTADRVPSAEDVVRFLHSVKEADLSFKATAGLHHAIRSRYPLTYEADAEIAIMHGFLNLAAAAATVWSGGSPRDTMEILLEEEPGAFDFRADALLWKGWTIHAEQLADMRQRFFHSFGSCSIREPVAKLHRLRLL